MDSTNLPVSINVENISAIIMNDSNVVLVFLNGKDTALKINFRYDDLIRILSSYANGLTYLN